MEVLWYIGAFALSVIFGKPTIAKLRSMKMGQEIREEGPRSHLKKAGTPTMGGVFFIAAYAFLSILYAFLFPERAKDVLFLCMAAGLFGGIGAVDDLAKIKKKTNLGLNAKQKLVLQIAFSVVCCIAARLLFGLGTEVSVPFYGAMIDLGIFYYPLIVLMMTGITNGVNLSDGLDGLSAGISAIVLVGVGIFATKVQLIHVRFASFLLSGSLLGFLLYNYYPARVFMGDTGSLFIGGFLGAAFLRMQAPLHLVLIGFIYVVEVVSVMLQVVYFKKTGKRLFRMAPIHHHFEMKGYHEKSIVPAAYALTAAIVAIALWAL